MPLEKMTIALVTAFNSLTCDAKIGKYIVEFTAQRCEHARET